METELNLDPDSNLDPNLELDQELNADPDPYLQIILGPAGSRSTTLNFSNFFLVHLYDKTKFLRFIVHSSMIITVRVIPNIVRKLLILTQFWLFDLIENMLNDVVVPFFSLNR